MVNLSDPETLKVLSTIYRARPQSRAELEALDSLPRHRLDEILGSLETAGLVSLEGGGVDPRSPDRAMAALSASVLSEEVARLGTLIETTATMSALTRDWELGSSGDSVSSWAEIVHGQEQQFHAWARYGATHPSRDPITLYPNLVVLRTVIYPGLLADPVARTAAAHMRIVIPASALSQPHDRQLLDELAALGITIRILERVPSGLYADAGVLCALPLTWGEDPPISIVIIQQPTIVRVVSMYVDSLWRRAIAYPTADQTWWPILRLLANGMPDATIAATLGLSLRTVQRRITEAMDSFAVHSRFELGVAWAEHLGSHAPVE
ncbi:MAG: helix-turn-helix transcriptional regulator [Rhodoglobus sp.]